MSKVIVITSGKGGVGKTTTSANIATGIALRGHKTIAIAGVYRTTETPLPKDVAGKPAQVRLVDGVLVMTPLKIF